MALRGLLAITLLCACLAGRALAQGVPASKEAEPGTAPAADHALADDVPNRTTLLADLPKASGRTVSFRELVAKARQNPPAVLSALATLERVRAEQRVVEGTYYPRFSAELSEGITYNNSPQPGLSLKSTAVSTNASVAVDLTLFDATRQKDVKAAQGNAKAQEATYQDLQRAAIEGAASLYFQSLAARRLIVDAELTLERRTAQYESIAALARAGVRPGVDAQRAEIEVVVARSALEMRKIDEQSLASALSAALGEDPLTSLSADAEAGAALGEVHAPRDAAVLAAKHRPDVRTLEAALHASVARDQSARAARYPTAGINGQGTYSHVNVVGGQGLQGNFYGAGASVYLRWAALDATVWRRKHVTSAAVLEAERALDATLLRVRNEAVAAAFAGQRAKVRLQQAEQVLAGAQVTRVSQNERYRAGVATLLELLDAEALEQAARLSRIEAQREYDIARARLLSATGTIAKLGS
jgi:outer membrane protein TolC